MQHSQTIDALLRHINRAQVFLRWLRGEGESLVASAQLLGGSHWARRASTVVHAARAGHDLSAHRGALRSLRRLLHLEFVRDLETPEAARFAALHPDDPRADQARLCAEALDRGVRALEALRLAGISGVEGAA
ncbi:MAG: hypothetical protein FH759_08910 [Sediminimonas qiaohouensis]|uniref:Uncharacterized protein n=1 Tax=Sediminimonas qiaohouensis TaxID=552061 RepID=A0A7C9L805_9RHOB|nr:hypothetical protein [Sediminimonas qiaohouensis]MTJ04795.1 hypothetical protein [Sediminimonas qiaohouensis]